MGAAIVAEGLRKRFGETQAVDGFDLVVAPGSICGLLGPNGAGKTTVVRILATLLRADEGRAMIDGADVATEPHEVRRRIGWSGQAPAVDEILSGRQNLVLFGRLNRLGKAEAGRRADELLERFDLGDAARKSVKHYSGGMRRRLDLAVTLILSPGRAVPRRADDRPRPAWPQRGVVGDPLPRRRRDDRAADDAVPRRGRPAGRPDRGDRHRPHHRRGHVRRARRRRSAAIGSTSWSTATPTSLR